MAPTKNSPIMDSRKNYYWRLAGFYFFYYAFVGMFAPYWSLYLKSLHFSAIDIGILMAVQPVMRMIAPNLWGWLADQSGQRLLIVQVAAGLSLLFYLGVFLTTSFWGMLLVLALMSFFWSASMPLVEATTLTWLGGKASHYGRIRSWGSLGFIVTVLGLGYAFDYIAIAWLLWAGLVCELGILLFSRMIPATEAHPHPNDHQPIRHIVFQPVVLALFGACFLMAMAHGPYYTFYSIHLVEHGYSKGLVGALWALGVICEIGVFFLMPRLMRHFSFFRLLQISLFAAVVRFLMIAWLVDVLAWLLLAQVLHALTFGAFHASSVGLVHEYFRGRHQARGQALFGSLTYGAGGMLGSLTSGPVWEHWGPEMLFSLSALAAFTGIVLLRWQRPGMANHVRAVA